MLHKDGTVRLWPPSESNADVLVAGVATDSAILFSPLGTSAVLIGPSIAKAIVVTGLPSKPQVSDLSLPAGFSPLRIAVGNDGTILAGVTRSAAGVQLGILSETRAYTSIGTVQAWGGASFLPGSGGDAAVIADGATGHLTYASNLNGASPLLVPLADAGLLQKPVAVSISPDGKWAYAVDSAKAQIVRISIGASTVAPASIGCACTPQQLVPLTADGVFLLSANVPGQPAWILDTRTEQPRTFFVPALPGSPPSQNSETTVKPAGRTGQ
jgi:hypothetical protein